MLGIWNYSEAVSEPFIPWLRDAPSTPLWPICRLCRASMLALCQLSASPRMQFLSAKRTDPCDALRRTDCDAELQQGMVKANPRTICLHFFSSTQSWTEWTLPFAMKVQLPSSSLLLPSLQYIFSLLFLCLFLFNNDMPDNGSMSLCTGRSIMA